MNEQEGLTMPPSHHHQLYDDDYLLPTPPQMALCKINRTKKIELNFASEEVSK